MKLTHAIFMLLPGMLCLQGRAASSEEFFQQKVYPLLQSKCIGCHGDAGQMEADLDLRSREGFLKGGESGQTALVPGKPEQSRAFNAVLRTGKLKMPPKDRNKLDAEEIETFRKWIADGAQWFEIKTNAPKWSYKAEDIWAFRPVKKRDIPALAGSTVRNPVDAFIQEKLKEKNLKPAPLADRVTLIRRATYDLTGLPPTPQEIDSFVRDRSTNAFDKVIERLLASPRYGEQWGRHWLDVVRYADTDGYSNDYERPNAWRYRDYVIHSFNVDKPYDQFVMEQIAGDEMTHTDPEKLIAVGMLRMGPWEQTAMSVAAVTRQLFLDDVTANIGAAYLGLTTGCAKCHDHKFDPIPTRDYYRLQSVFAPSQFQSRKVPFQPWENASDLSADIKRVQQELTTLRGRVEEIQKKHQKAMNQWVKANGYKTLKEVPAEKKPGRELGLTALDRSIEKTLQKRIEYLDREMNRYEPLAFSLTSGTTNEILHILQGGALEAPGDAVTPGLISAVYRSDDSKNPTDWNTVPQTPEGRRLKLAKWIASPDHPLTARVMVNRIWQYHFGKGLVETPNNFGKMGKRPTHPELLDWLATYFIKHNWSIKDMHRLIMRSYAYQQSVMPVDADATKREDPEEKLISHFMPRRLTAEELRDSMLLVSGELSETRGGPPVFPEINLEAALQPRHIMGSLAPVYLPSPTREQRNRRTIYTAQIRSLLNPVLEVFNCPNTTISLEKREATIVTPQVFALFNSKSAHDSALAMADRIYKTTHNRSRQIEQAYLLAYGRKPTSQEKKLCSKHLDAMIAEHRATKPLDFEFPKKITRTFVEEMTGEPFEFTEDWTENYEPNLRPSEVPPETRGLADLCLVLLNANEFAYIY